MSSMPPFVGRKICTIQKATVKYNDILTKYSNDELSMQNPTFLFNNLNECWLITMIFLETTSIYHGKSVFVDSTRR